MKMVLVFAGFTLLASCAQAQDSAEKVYGWLLRQQTAQGILGNQEDDAYSGVYSNALAALCYLHQGDVENAEKILKFYDERYDATCGTEPGGFFQFWDSMNGQPHTDTDRWIGDNAWLLIAINAHRAKTGRDDFSKMRVGIAQWLISLQDKDGGIWSGFNQKGPIGSKATEGNLDAYAALVDHPVQRKKIRKFLETQMWIPKEDRFKMGSTSPDPALDCSSWGVAALGNKFKDTLRFAEKTFSRTQKSEATGAMIKGFADLRGKNRIWLEGTGEMVVAYHAAGELEKARACLLELEKAIVPSKAFPGTAGLPCHTNDPPWPGGDQKIFVPSQCWYLFGAWGYNPLATKD